VEAVQLSVTLLGETLEAANPLGALGGDTVGWMMVTAADACLVGSAAETAVTATVAGVGMAAGAEYTPAVDIRPTVVLPPVTPPTCQVTTVLLELVTVAEKVWLPVPTATLAEVGAILTCTAELVPLLLLPLLLLLLVLLPIVLPPSPPPPPQAAIASTAA
jgi:hypothetical protein